MQIYKSGSLLYNEYYKVLQSGILKSIKKIFKMPIDFSFFLSTGRYTAAFDWVRYRILARRDPL